MESIELLESDVVYRNPKPYLRSLQARHPSLVVFDDDELLLGFDLGQSDESLDYATHRARTKDGGHTWQFEGPLLAPTTQPPTTNSLRLSQVGNETVAFGNIHHRERPDEGLVNRATLGFVSTDLVLMRSQDRGRTWSAAERIVPPLESPAWETCHHVVELRSGRWLAPTSTWRGWNGEHPAGDQAVALISDDRGRSWPRYGRIFDGRPSGLIHWEVSISRPTPDGPVVAVAWVHDPRTQTDYPNRFAISFDDGETFAEPQSTGLHGQTCKLLQLQDGRLLCFYRRVDQPGLWANLATLDNGRWRNLSEMVVWQGENAGITRAETSADSLAALRVGYPSPVQLADGRVLVVFWCVEACQSVIRLARLKLNHST
jgi:hypothetical protein